MRSEKIHRALAQGMNRFEVCQLVAKGVKATHKTGGRFEDSINDVLQYLGTHKTPHGKSSSGDPADQPEEPQAGGVTTEIREQKSVKPCKRRGELRKSLTLDQCMASRLR